MNNFPESSSINNWITRLDDDIFVGQLSIPGTHDSATGNGMNNFIDGGQTQYLSLQDQLNMGIRAFDLRPARTKNGLHIYHGKYSTAFSWNQAISTLTTYLSNNPNEFVIVLFRHENEADTGLEWVEGLVNVNRKEAWEADIAKSLKNLKDNKHTVDFKPDLTVGECRGKILFFSRDKYTTDQKPIAGAYLDWNHNINDYRVDPDTNVKTDIINHIYGPDMVQTVINVQDCFNMSEADFPFGSGSNDAQKLEFKKKKFAAISRQLDKSAKFHKKEWNYTWSINHTSGYTAWKLPDTNDYRENAEYQNPEFYKKVLDPAWEGSTGIIIADWVGTDISPSTWGTREYKVLGARMPQVIIDNNFKFRMKHKGEQ